MDAAAELVGTQQLQGISSHVMFLARGKTGPFRVSAEAIAVPRAGGGTHRRARRGRRRQGDHHRLPLFEEG